mgnify:CR=1 FL=1
MNARIAAILKDRISQFTYVDRLAGMVRVGQMERAGQVVKLPIAIDADDDLACDDSTLRDMVPDERYACMVYFEDRGFQRITSRTKGTSYRSTLRLVCWVNTAKFSGDHMASERILQQFLGVVHAPSPVNTDTLVGLRTTAETGPERGGSLFSSYTYPESARPFLMWPFDAFAIDIAAEYRLRPGCEEDPVPGDDECWTPPTTKRRKNPSEFTCEELQDPVTGLTAEQLGPECLDCEGSAPCDPTTVNGVESDTPTITVLQGGVQVGTLNPATGVHTVPECEEPCAIEVDFRLNGGRVFGSLVPECGVNEYDIIVQYPDGTPVGEWVPVPGRIEVPAPVVCDDATVNVNGALYDTPASGATLNVPVLDSASNPVGTVNSGVNVVIADAQVQLQDSAANPIGSPVAIVAESTDNTLTCPDGSVSLNGTPVGSVKSNGSRNIPITLDGAAATGSWDGTTYDVDPVPSPANIVRQYTAGDTWTRPANLKELFVLVAAGGGGGGAAGQRVGGATGGSGGGGGMVRWLRIPASSLGLTETITIGAGGSGGIGGTGSASAGTNGGTGGTTSFGSHISAAGGSGGLRGETSGTITGGAGGTIAGIRFFLPGAAGGQAQAGASGSAGGNGWSQTVSGASGGGGGSSTSTPASWGGGNGGGVLKWNGSSWVAVAGPTGPAANGGAGGNGSDDICLHILQSLSVGASIGLGTGGAGGAGNTGTGSAVGLRGGKGGRAAGGGGGGSTQGGTGGNGGNGGAGFCILVEIY